MPRVCKEWQQVSQALGCGCRMNERIYVDLRSISFTCVSIVQCVIKRQATDNLLHMLDITCPFFWLLVTRCVDGSHMGGSEDIHQEDCWLGFRGNLQALGVAPGGGGAGAAALGCTPWLAAQQVACQPQVRLQS